jgi:hypothetical protein
MENIDKEGLSDEAIASLSQANYLEDTGWIYIIMLLLVNHIFTPKITTKNNYSRSDLLKIINDSDLSNKEKLDIIDILK